MIDTLRSIALVALFILVACGGKSTSATTPGGSGGADGACSGGPCAAAPADTAVDVSGFQQWTKINDEPYLSESHNNMFADIYVTPEHADAYRAMSGPMPVGLKVVKHVFKNVDGKAGDPVAVTAMVKMEAGYDAEGNDWYYGVYTADGSKAKMTGKMQSCKDCHENYEDTDYVSGVPSKE